MNPVDDQNLHWELEVVPGLSTRSGFLFGDCGLAAGIVAMEGAARRPTIYIEPGTAPWLEGPSAS
jgi:hypothetical protein